MREYWVIDPDAQEVEVIQLDAEPLQRQTYHGGDAVTSTVLPAFEEPAAEFFT